MSVPGLVEATWNVMAHVQKPGFRLLAKRTTPFKSARVSVQSTTGNRGVRISGSNAAYIMFRGSVKSTGYPLHSPVSPSLPLLCVTMCHHISTELVTQCSTLLSRFTVYWSCNQQLPISSSMYWIPWRYLLFSTNIKHCTTRSLP